MANEKQQTTEQQGCVFAFRLEELGKHHRSYSGGPMFKSKLIHHSKLESTRPPTQPNCFSTTVCHLQPIAWSQSQRLPAQERSRVPHHVSRTKKDVFFETAPAGTAFRRTLVLCLLLAAPATCSKPSRSLGRSSMKGDCAVTRD